MIDCVVVGAGQAGLATSHHLTCLGVEHVVLERGRVGETWRTARWDTFHLNTPNWATQLPGLAPSAADPDAFAPLADVVELLAGYADDIGAPVRRAEVTALRAARGSFQLTLGDDGIETRSVVVATGAFQQPTQAPAGLDGVPGMVRLHTSAYRNPGQLPEGGVLIVGSGQSGCEIGQELLEAGREVHLALGRCGWGPRRYRGREFVRWLVDVGLADETPAVLPSRRARLAGNVAVSGTNGGRDCNPLVLERSGARLYGRFERFEAGRAVFAPDLGASLEFGATFDERFRLRCDEHARAVGLELPRHPPAPAQPGRDHDPCELAVEREGVRTVLWAGGFRPAFSWVELPIFDELGFPRAERGVTDVPGLAFVGLPWLSKRKSPLLLGVGEDAGHVAAAVAAHLASAP